MQISVRPLVALASMVVLGCGGGHALTARKDGGSPGLGGLGDSAGASAEGGSSGTTGGGTTGAAGTLGSSPCPSAAPPDGSPCSQDALTCGWGDDVRGDTCRTAGVCFGQRWQITQPNATTCPPLQDVGTCPADVGAACVQDTTCTNAGGGGCRCTNCRPTSPTCGLGPPSWYCPTPQGRAGCPADQPNFGAPCTSEGVSCSYLLLACGQPDRVCSGGIWVPGTITQCPVSTRRAKKDIHYLSPTEIDALAKSALDLRLATYEYRSAPYAGRRHLGFIIEDSPNTIAVDRDADMIDLYGYTSMLLGAVQRQQREIESLRRQVETLSRPAVRHERRQVGLR